MINKKEKSPAQLFWFVAIGLLMVYYVCHDNLNLSVPKWFSIFFWIGIVSLFIAIGYEIWKSENIPKPKYFTQKSANVISILLKLYLGICLIIKFLEIKYAVLFLLGGFVILLFWNVYLFVFPDAGERQKGSEILDDI